MKTLLYIFFFPLILPYLLIKELIKIFGKDKIKSIGGRDFRIYIAGAQYKNDDGSERQNFIRKCKLGEELLLVKTPSEHDEYGIQIYRRSGECLGWVPAKFSYEFTSEMGRGVSIRAFFHSKINPNKEYNYYSGRITIIKQVD